MRKWFLIVALGVLSAVISFNSAFSKDADSYFREANSMLISGNFEESVRMYNSTIKENPKYADAYVGLGIAYKELGRYEDALNATKEALRLKPTYYQAYYNLGLIYEKLNNSQEAINAYEKFLNEVPGAEKFSDARQRIIKLKKSNQE